jgi:hypothetical protein
MTCGQIRRQLSGYLDGALPGGPQAEGHALVRRHLEICPDCREELERYGKLSMLMSRAERATPPADLLVRLRVGVSQARASYGWARRLKILKSRAHLTLENVLEPVALPATCGVLGALVVFAVILQFVAVGVPLGAVPNDLPTTLLQPARLESLAPFPVPGLENSGRTGPHALLIEATVNAQGEVVDYQILAGPHDRVVRRQLDQVLLFSRFRPQMSFGRPTARGRVVLSFSEIRVKG